MTDSASSQSTTPMLLTPESTGTNSPDAAAKKARRQTAFYPNMNSSNKPQKPFSRSAAKRESVMALGSIEHLQHYFTKTGLVSKQNPLADKYNLKPAIGGLKLRVTSPTEDTILELPPSPEIPSQPITQSQSLQGPHIRNVETDPETLLPGMIDDLIDVSNAWSIDSQTNMDILATLKTTTRAIRSVRNYVLSLPDESTGTIRAQFRPMSLSTHLHSGTAAAAAAKGSPKASSKEDPLTLIRKVALEVLTVLRELEERARLPLTDDAYDAQSDSGSGSGSGGGAPTKGGTTRVESPSASASASDVDTSSSPAVAPLDLPDYTFDPDTSITYIQLPHKSVPVWEDEDSSSNAFFVDDNNEEKRETWDDKLVLQSGWLYKQDITLSALEREKEAVERYLDVVDEVLFRTRPGAAQGERGWVKEKRKIEAKFTSSLRAKRRRTSTGDVERALGIGKQPFLSLGDNAAGAGAAARRRVTLGSVLPMLDSLALSEEPLGLSGMPAVTEESPAGDQDHESGTDEGGSTDIDESELPIWARLHPSPYPNELERTHALLVALLPTDLLPALVSPPDNDAGRLPFLESLSSGQLLCVAYNTGVRRSRKPWGFVAKEGIHDIISLERASAQEKENGERKSGGGGGWTFRRTDNLRLFVGALKLRYGVGVVVPPRSAAAIPAPAPQSNSNAESLPTSPILSKQTGQIPLVFDPKVVASKGEGWDTMLEKLVSVWVDGVVSERRIER